MRIASRRPGVTPRGSSHWSDLWKNIESDYVFIGEKPKNGEEFFMYDNKTIDKGIEIPNSPTRNESLYERLTKEQYD